MIVKAGGDIMEIIQLSSLDKIFLDSEITKIDYKSATALKGEKFSYQICYRMPEADWRMYNVDINVESEIKEYITVYSVGQVPSCLPVNNDRERVDGNYITDKPGLFPDVLYPLERNGFIYKKNWSTIWIEIKLPKDIIPKEYKITVSFNTEDKTEKTEFTLEVINAVLPEQKLKFTQWFHCDCLKTYYGVKEFDDEHFRIIKNFVKMAADNGMNMILTPVITPTLDVDEGGERPTVQLVKIYKDKDKYTFDFSDLEKFIKISLECGIKYFEIAHLFTQWGAKYAPKVMGYENGVYKKLFGWETSAASKEYSNFLRQFVPALTAFFDKKNMKDKVYFHISDEPKEEDLDTYKVAKELLFPLLDGYKCMDALSDYEYYEKGLVNIPVVANNHIDSFFDKNIPELWTYYCSSQDTDVSNRFFSMPSYRNRIIGIQMFKYNIKGFLHWGYNFYYSARTRCEIDPFTVTDAMGIFPSGDSFSVYPGKAGVPYPSLRLIVFNEALQDLRALEALKDKIGYEKTVEIIEEGLLEKIDFKTYPHNSEYILNLREKINRMLV